MKVAVTGANGFVASALIDRLLADGLGDGRTVERVLAIDITAARSSPERVSRRIGSLADAALREDITAFGPDIVFHLAAVPGGAAAADPALGWSVNVDATVALVDLLGRLGTVPRLVFSSSIGVFGVPLPPDRVDDETLPLPTMSYGTHKLIGEAVVADHTRRGLIDGLALRLPGIVARPRQAGGHITAYMSNVFHALAAGEAISLPVSPEATSWFMSRNRCVDNLVHAAGLARGAAGNRIAFNLPALRLDMRALVAGIADHTGADAERLVSYAPQPEIKAQFGAYPPLHTPISDGLGFRHDGDAAALAARALEAAAPSTRSAM